MTIHVVIPDDEPNITIRTIKLSDDSPRIERQHYYQGVILKDGATIDMTNKDDNHWVRLEWREK